MKVFGVGLQKTGTTTLGSCMVELKYKKGSYHRRSVWHLRKNRIERLIEFMNEYDAFDDEPWAHCYKIADQLYLDVKFILTIRDSPERWYNSLCRHCDRIPFNEHRKYFFGSIRPRQHKKKVLAAYNAHNQKVIDYFKDRPGKLLVMCWERGDGWAELCRFLGTPVPSTPFPWSNPSPSKPAPSLTTWRILKYMPRYGRYILITEYSFLITKYIRPAAKKVLRCFRVGR